jgi:peptidoglycan/LPS O-acetylase OafA/YrhL
VAIAFGCMLVIWLVQHAGFEHAPGRAAFSDDAQSPWGYLSAVLLLQGFVGPLFAGYAAAWSLSIELWTNVLLVVAIAAVPWARRRQFVGPAALLIGAAILATADPKAENAIGLTAFARGLTGLGAGMVIYRIYTAGLRPGPDSTTSSMSRSGRDRPARWPGIGAVIGLSALVACLYWSRDLRPLNFLPMVPVAGLLVFCLIQPSDGPAHRLMRCRIVQWLGSRSFALYALHGSVLMAIRLACRLRGLPLHDPKVAVFIVVTTLVGALAAAEVGHRFIERVWVPKPA